MVKKRLEEIRKIRLQKVEQLRKLGIDPYPSKVKGVPKPVKKALENEGKIVEVAGRIMGWRGHGNVVFADLKDESGQIQLWFQKNILKDDFQILKYFDIGDFLFVKGNVTKTKAGELTIDVDEFQLLTKSIRSLPSKWYGLKDEESRYRQRYVDLILNDDLKDLFKKKAIFWQSMRDFMIEHGFLEVETPVLENTAGGADANPFITHHDTLNTYLYLRISMGELWQKRLMVAGFEKTFEIGRQFRNEGISHEHLQDYSQMEFYWAYANYEDSMKLVEEMYKFIAEKTFGKMKFEIGDFDIDLGKNWEKIDYTEAVKKSTGIDISAASEDEIRAKLRELGIEYEEKDSKGRFIDSLWKYVRRSIAGPAFLVGHPVEVSPLAKRQREHPEFVERYQVILAGSEMGNGYSELNDPVDQERRFKDQQKLRDEGDEEAQMHDEDFVRALEYGMPPTTGFGVSERLFSFLADLPIREAVLFPLLKPEKVGDKKKKDRTQNNSNVIKTKKSKVDIGISYEKAKELIEKYIKDDITKLHSRESEVIMRALAKHFGEDEDKWGIIGLLHDIDWDLTRNDTSKHCIEAVKILKNAGASDFLIETLQSHAYGSGWESSKYYGPNELSDKKRTTKIQHALAAAETLTGLIVATALVQPERKLKNVKPSSLKKKFNNKNFAANCNREIMMECEKIGLSLDKFLEIGLKALQNVSGELGL